MDEQSTTASDLVRAYRRGRTLDDDARARIETRLAASIAAPTPVVGPAAPSRRRFVLAGVAALAAAAILVLALRGWTQQAEHAEPSERGQAPYEHRDDTQPQPVRDGATVPAPPRGPAAQPEPTSPVAPIVTSPAAVRPSSRPAPRPESPAVTFEDTSLSEELAIVRRVRAALERDDASTALAAIAEHERRFATGQLVEERKSLRVEALCLAGKPAQARAEAKTFLREHSGSAHADRVRSACPDR